MDSTRPARKEIRITPAHVAFLISFAALLVVAGFAAGVVAERDLLSNSSADDPLVIGSLSLDTDGTSAEGHFSRFEDVVALIDEEYYSLPSKSEEAAEFWSALEEHAIQGLTSGLDGFSTYLPKVEQERAAEQLEGAYEGIGVWITSKNNDLTIIAPIPGSPAERAGLLAGDVILEADGQPVAGLTADEALELVRGPEGSTVTLAIRREGVSEPMLIEVERQKIILPAVAYEFLPDEKVAVAQITIFGARTIPELDQAIARAQKDGAIGMVIDLRNNGGGWVESAREVIGRFVPADQGAALIEDFDPSIEGDERSEPILAGEGPPYELPLAVIVNRGTASASEIVAGALQDYDRAVLVGEKTYGKGSVQRVHPFDDGASLRLTFAHWLTPNGSRIDGEGITPDIVVEGAEESSEPDIQLDAAIQSVIDQAAGNSEPSPNA